MLKESVLERIKLKYEKLNFLLFCRVDVVFLKGKEENLYVQIICRCLDYIESWKDL